MRELPEKDFWPTLCLLASGCKLRAFSTAADFVSAITDLPSPVAILIDEFQCLLDFVPTIRASFLGALKMIRDSIMRKFHGCLAFGTYRQFGLAHVDDGEPDLQVSPFSSTTAIQMRPVTGEQMRSVLVEYRRRYYNFSRIIIDDIIALSGCHIGIFGILCALLSSTLREEGWSYKHWEKAKRTIYDKLYCSRPFSLIVKAVRRDESLYGFLHASALVKEDSFFVPDTPHRFTLLDIGALVLLKNGECTWPSPLIRLFLVQFLQKYKTEKEVPPLPLSTDPVPTLVIDKLCEIVSSQIDLSLILRSLYRNRPTEIAFQIEWYRVIKQMLLREGNTHTYHISFETPTSFPFASTKGRHLFTK